MERPKYEVVTPDDGRYKPEPHELEVAEILARHYGSVIMFLKPVDTYKVKTPDLIMNGVEWEIKSPMGKSKKYTIVDQFKKASKQSKSIVLDCRRTLLPDDFILKQIERKLNEHKSIKRVIFIGKDEKILEIKK
ncbi:MAG: hypothetical protein LBM97_00605 [Candidatus Nomurabacteria bacterium]|jgi:hypothetical protein|nr:hypothetical protein [Candidatus Nomurabacteria bacterium]